MKKMSNFLILHLFLSLTLISKEPTLAILTDIKSNDSQQFKIGNYKFDCMPYGVLGIDELYNESSFNSECKKSINRFYEKRADLKYYTNSKLKVMQFYNIEFKNARCIIYVSGEKSLSESLLEEGLAILKPSFKDEEFGYYFNKSQKKAKAQKKGVWAENIMRECVSNIYNK